MSNTTNTLLLEKAHELSEELLSHPSGLDKQILTSIQNNDLEGLQRLITIAEGTLAQEHFKEITEDRDEY